MCRDPPSDSVLNIDVASRYQIIAIPSNTTGYCAGATVYPDADPMGAHRLELRLNLNL